MDDVATCSTHSGPVVAALASGAIRPGDLVGLGDVLLGTDIAPAAVRATSLGRWQAITCVGSLLAPAIAAPPVPASLLLNGIVGLTGTAWMASWTPRLVPRQVTGRSR